MINNRYLENLIKYRKYIFRNLNKQLFSSQLHNVNSNAQNQQLIVQSKENMNNKEYENKFSILSERINDLERIWNLHIEYWKLQGINKQNIFLSILCATCKI